MADLNIGNSSASVLVNAKHNGSVIPQANNTYDLGTSALKWKNIYGGTFIGSLNGNAATATNADKLDNKHANEFMYFNYDVGLGSGSPANIAKSYFVDNEKTPKGMIKGYYNDSGEEYSQLYSRSKVGNTGSILKWGYNDRYIRILRHRGGWLSEDWEKIDAGNADTATKLATARFISLGTGVTSTATSFDGSNNITIPVNSIKESYLTWGGRNFNGDYGCIDAAMVSDLGANRLMFGKAAGITIQYSTDGGNNWTDYGASDSEKVGLFSSGCGFNIGKATKDTITANCMLRVIINTDSFGVYTKLNKFVIYLSTNGSSGCYCTIDASLESSPTTFTTFANKVPVSGWSGYNVINTSGITTYGNSQSSQYGLIRFTFGCSGVNTNYSGLNIIQIMGFGGVGWVTPSTMAKTGHLYSYDRSQNAAFPATVTAPTFSGALLGNASTATKATQDSAGQQINTTYIKGLSISGKTITYTKGDGSTGTITTQDNNTTYSAGTGLSLSGTTFNHKNSVTAGTAQGDASKTLTFGGTFTIPTITYDAQGHITGKGTTTMTMPANPNTDTHWTTGITAGATGTTSNSATTNGNTFIKIKDNSTHRGQIKLVGSGATSVSSNAEGVITISSTDNNTTYGSMSVSEGTTGTATTNRVLTAANLKGIINAHAPTKTGGGASGTWGISISGNAASASKVNNKLTVGSKSYDGSAAVTIAASDLGLASAMLFLGTTTTAIKDGATTNPVAISGSNKTVTAGNVVLYGSKEFVWTGSAWEELGNEGSYKIVQAAVADPSASGTSNTFIATISQDTNGKITATKKTVAVTNSAPTLAWGTTSTIGTVAGTNLQVKMPANPNTDTKVTQTAINAADYTNWRPLIWGASNNGTEGFTPSTVTDGVFTAQTLSCQPSSGTIRATTFKGNLSGNAATATKLQTARTISLAGSVTGSGTFDGSGNLSISTTTNHSHNYLSYKSILDSESAINSFHAANAFQAAIWSGTSSPGVSNGIILDMGYTSTTYGAQIAIDDDPTYFMALRQRGSGGWNAWKRIPMGDGTGASGTWGISVTGSSASCTGNAATATKLATTRTIRTNLASTSAASFDGSANIAPGVTGTLPIANGGTGATNASAARNNLGAQSKVLYGTSAPSNSTGSNGDMYIALESGDFKKDIVNLIYPVGSIYISMNSTNPSTLFGGTWQAFGQGRTLIGVGTGNDGTISMSFTSGGKTGGTYKNTHNHYTLYSNDGAAFFMSMSSNAPRSRVVTKDRASWTLSNSSNVTREDSTYNETIDIVQPYITVYFWRRTA